MKPGRCPGPRPPGAPAAGLGRLRRAEKGAHGARAARINMRCIVYRVAYCTCQIFVSVIYTQPIASPFSHVCAHADVCTDSAAARHTRRQRSSGLAILHTTRTGRPAKRHSPVRRGLWPREEARTRRSGRSAEHTANVVTHATRRRHHIATAAATAPNARQNVTGCRSTSKVVCGLHWACAFLRPMRHGCAHRGGHSAADLGVGSPRRRSVRRGGGHLHRALCSDVLAVRWGQWRRRWRCGDSGAWRE
jgi:hypothetical protein